MENNLEKGKTNERRGMKRSGSLFILLVLLVFATTSVLGGRLGTLTSEEKNVIALIPSAQEQALYEAEQKGAENTGQNGSGSVVRESAEEGQTENESSTGTDAASTGTAYVSFQAEDETQIWTSMTDIEIFHVSYVNGNEIVTVNSDDGDNLLAPGTGHEYTFQLKNTGGTALDYTMEIEAYISPDEYAIPVEVKVKGEEGAYLLGSEQEWAPVLTLNDVQEQMTLEANQYAGYTLEWQWPYETGQDEADTMLGNLAENEDISLNIVIHTTASQDLDAAGTQTPGADSETAKRKIRTGDMARYGIYVVILLAAAAVIVYVLAGKRKNRNDEIRQDGRKKR